MKIIVDFGLCEGNGACVIEAPEIFELDDDDNLIVLDEAPSEALRAKAQAAARSCPKRAIQVED